MRHISKIVSGGGSTTTVSQITSTFDTRGFAYATISVFGIASTIAPSTTSGNHILAEADTETVATNFVTISGATPSPLAVTTAIATNIAKMVYNVDLRGRKRYLKVTYTPHSGDALLVTCDLTNAADGIVTTSEQGSAASATI
jgi:Ni,Fe-hydrogenase III small subunit